MQAREMLETHPRRHSGGAAEAAAPDEDALVRCIEACASCAQTCIACADACLGEPMVADMVRCIRLNLDCADVCTATLAVVTRQTGENNETVRRLLQACAEACGACARECERHAPSMEHCRICAAECRACEDACMAAGGVE